MNYITYMKNLSKIAKFFVNVERGRFMTKSIFRIIFIFLLVAFSTTYAQLLLNEGFDGTTFPPSGWTTFDNVLDYWVNDRNGPHVAPGCAFAGKFGGNPHAPSDAWLVTPRLQPLTGHSTLEFWYRGFNRNHYESLEVWISRSGNTQTDFQTPGVGYRVDVIGMNLWDYTLRTISLASFTNQPIYVAFRYVGVNTNRHGVFIDDVGGNNGGGVPYASLDVGVSAITKPDTLALPGAIFPEATVKNFGSLSVSFWTRCVIETITGARTFLRCSVYTNNLGVNLTKNLNFASVNLSGGFYRVKVKTLLAGDMQSNNDSMVKKFRIMANNYKDVGVTKIYSPLDTVQYNNNYYPSINVKNYGSYYNSKCHLITPFTIKIKNLQNSQIVYTKNDTINLAPLGSGTFNAETYWKATYGSYLIFAYTTLVGDQIPANDTAYAYIYCPLKDAGVDIIIRPDTIELPNAFTPQARIRNYGTATISFWTRCEIEVVGSGTVYRDSILTSNLVAGLTNNLSFTSVTLGEGSYRIKVTTLCENDVQTNNDQKTKTFRVLLPNQTDAGVIQIITPIGSLEYNGQYYPSVRIKNFGTQTDLIPVTIKIIRAGQEIYTSSGNVSIPSLGTALFTATTQWTAAIGSYQIVAFTWVAGDKNPNNDTCIGQAECSLKDVGVLAIIRPDTIELPSLPFNPQATIKNFGQEQVTFYTRCVIDGTSYRDSIQTTLSVGQSTNLVFAPITINGGTYLIRYTTLLVDDAQPANDMMSKTFRVIPNNYKDAGISAIYSPVGDLERSVQYRCIMQVRNYSAQTENVPIVIKIKNLQNDSVVFSDSKSITIPITQIPIPKSVICTTNLSWTATVGVFQVMAYTQLSGDADATNDTCISGAVCSNIDAAILSIENPRTPWALIEPDGNIIPCAKITNYSWMAKIVNVTLSIQGGYSCTKAITLNAGYDSIIYFDVWIPQVGTFATKCSVYLDRDMRSDNNVKTGSVFIPVRDIQPMVFIAPDTNLLDPTLFVPQVAIQNNGNYRIPAAPVEMAICNIFGDTIYCDTSYVNLFENSSAIAYFRYWYPEWYPPDGQYFMATRTIYAHDMVESNNLITKTIYINQPFRDIALTAINSPHDSIGIDYPVIPKVSITNNGNIPLAFAVVTEIQYYNVIPYCSTKYISTPLSPGHSIQLTFPPFQPSGNCPGEHQITSYAVILDTNPHNDTVSGVFQVAQNTRRDCGVYQIISPSSRSIPMPTGMNFAVQLAAKVGNYGSVNAVNMPLSFKIQKVGIGYPEFDQTMYIDLDAGNNDATILQPVLWAPQDTGTYLIKVRSSFQGDRNILNDTSSFTVNVYIPQPIGWRANQQITLPVRDGGALTYVPNSGIYAFTGNRTTGFFQYDVINNIWNSKASVPSLVGKGATLCNDGMNKIYAVVGNNSKTFMSYNISNSQWSVLESVPLGPRKKKLYGGSGLAFVPKGDSNFVFLVKGNRTREFYAYYVQGDTWLRRESIPVGYSPRILPDYGSSTATDGYNYIYLLKSTTNELYVYNVTNNTWTAARGLPFGDLRPTKVKAGGSLTHNCANRLYAFKGGNTREFWCYSISNNNWSNTSYDIPLYPSNKKISNGAALTFAEGSIYALKGNGTTEFLKFIPSLQGDQIVNSNTVEAEMLTNANIGLNQIKIAVRPNIVKNVTLVHYQVNDLRPITIKLYNIAGNLVKSETRTISTKTGNFNFDVSNVSAGTYFLRFETGVTNLLEKIVVQK